MFLHVQNLLDGEQLEAMSAGLATATFSAAETASGEAEEVAGQAVLQLDKEQSPAASDLESNLIKALGANPTLKAASLPSRILPPVFVKHTPGMASVHQADAPILTSNPPVRTDISVVVFLTDPSSYEGGDLTIKTDLGDANFRLPQGDALVYPSGAIHSVQEVTSGERVTALTWIQSIVREADKRQMLFDLEIASQLSSKRAPNSDEARLVLKTYGNLLRKWADV